MIDRTAVQKRGLTAVGARALSERGKTEKDVRQMPVRRVVQHYYQKGTYILVGHITGTGGVPELPIFRCADLVTRFLGESGSSRR